MSEQQTSPQAMLEFTLRAWIKTRNRALPPPCPRDPGHCAMWWLEKMCQPGEDFAVSRNALLRFIELPDHVDRQFVVAAVKDGIPYRGDGLGQFVDIHEETQRQRKAPQEYRELALAPLQGYLRRRRQEESAHER